VIAAEQIDIARVKADVEAAFYAYEAALMRNDLDALDQMFWQSPLTIRFGTGENLYGITAIRAFRIARNIGALPRTLCETRVTTYGEDFATTTTEFVRADGPVGRQSQSWVRFADGWRIVAAHISLAGRDSRTDRPDP